MNSANLKKRKDIKDSFLFSEINKNKMKNDDLELSSIEDDKIDINNKNKKPIKRVYGSIQLNNRQIHEALKKTTENNEKVEINSEKDSLISILSDLM